MRQSIAIHHPGLGDPDGLIGVKKVSLMRF
jgi:hypothetical protein